MKIERLIEAEELMARVNEAVVHHKVPVHNTRVINHLKKALAILEEQQELIGKRIAGIRSMLNDYGEG